MNGVIDPRSVDRPNSYIGKSVPRPNAGKLVEGRGQYVDDMVLPRMAHVAFVRSPHAHAKILKIDGAEALGVAGVLRVFTGAELAPHYDPWVATLAHLKGMKSAPQLPLPLERATWVGEAVAAVVAESRALAEDAVARVKVDYAPLPAVVDMETALDPSQPAIHPELGDNLCFQRVNETGKVDEAFNAAHKVVEATFHTGRQTGVTLEPRSILADYNRAAGKLTVHHATQAPHMMQGVFAKHLRLPEGDVRVICADVGAFVRRERAALGPVDPARRDLLSVDEECAHAALADPAAVVGELVADRRLPGRQRLLGGHRVALEAQPVVRVRRLAIL